MNIEDILPDSHRRTADFAAQIIIKSPENLRRFISEIYKHEGVLAMRMTRALAIAYELSPDTIHKHTGELLEILCTSENHGMNRGILKIFQHAWKVLNNDQLGKLLNISFNYLENPAAEIAPRVYSMNIIYEYTAVYPEIKNELESIIEFHYEEGSPAFRAVSRKLLKKLKKNK